MEVIREASTHDFWRWQNCSPPWAPIANDPRYAIVGDLAAKFWVSDALCSGNVPAFLEIVEDCLSFKGLTSGV